MKINIRTTNSAGFTLIEGIVGIAIFSLFAIGIYGAFTLASQLVEVSRMLVASAALANEQFEIAHNLPYSDVGLISGGIPRGKLSQQQNIARDNFNFLVLTTVRNIDDPFDGTIGGSPNDTSPADYKQMEVTISVPGNTRFSPQTYTEYIAPKNLENSSTNGALFVRAIDSNGQPVPQANVHIENNSLLPALVIDDVTNNAGVLEIVDTPPSVKAYSIKVSKAGYSQDQTYAASSTNPNPTTPDATVAIQQVTQTTFVIDRTATLNVESVTETCAPVANISFSLVGSKLIGLPNELKYSNNLTTGASGAKSITGLDGDTYTLTYTDTTHDLAGSISPIPLSLAAGSSQDVKLISVLKNPRSLLVSVRQAGTTLAEAGATVELQATSTEQLITGRGFLRQSDWSGGSGQENFLDPTAYSSSDGNIETGNPAGEIKLKEALGTYAAAGELTSSIFDTGSASNFYQLTFLPTDQPAETGLQSVRLQIATNNDETTWNFTGPDGTASSYYTATDTNIDASHNNTRYLRYKIYLATASTTFTPDVGEVSFTFTSLCVPLGQVLFDGLDAGTYTLTVSKSGFQTSIEQININSPWSSHQVDLQPE